MILEVFSNVNDSMNILEAGGTGAHQRYHPAGRSLQMPRQTLGELDKDKSLNVSSLSTAVLGQVLVLLLPPEQGL